jgi:ubiquinone/menaquinone biosynthesis C-methylase UbiE
MAPLSRDRKGPLLHPQGNPKGPLVVREPGEQGRKFWSDQAPGLKWLPGSNRVPVSRHRYESIRATRYRLEPHLEELAEFGRHAGQVVVEVGCGVGTDGSRFLEGGARYLGVDSSDTAVRTARRTLDMLGLEGAVVSADATVLPIRGGTVDFVYSNGVLHHVGDTQAAVDEIHRILRPEGSAVVMLYHRSSFNYRFNILVLRRLGALALVIPGAIRLISRLTGEPPETLEGHQRLLRRHGLRYLVDRRLFLSNNTDGPGNPLSKVYSAREARQLFRSFRLVETEVRFLNLRTLPAIDRRLDDRTKDRLARRWGWHLYVRVTR